ncbi:MAG TPA: hypothetical protein VMT95_15695 [Candidatus Binatia bacterium]|nr:hypothetical protein [Candidatus Binatia bacterium]
MGFSLRVEGLDQVIQSLEDVSKALQQLQGHIVPLRFNAADEERVQAAVQEAYDEIDRRLASFKGNAMVQSIASQFKAKAAENIRHRAAQAREQPDSS